MNTAIVFITTAVDQVSEVAEEVAALDSVTEVYSVTGDVDLIAVAKVSRHEEFHDVIADRLNKVEGVLQTSTHIAFRTYSSEDLEAGFDIGLSG